MAKNKKKIQIKLNLIVKNKFYTKIKIESCFMLHCVANDILSMLRGGHSNTSSFVQSHDLTLAGLV